MRKLFFTGIVLLVMGSPRAQSITAARTLMYYERYEGATRQLRSLLRTDPGNSEAWWLLTQACLHQHQLREIKDSIVLMPASISMQPFALCARGDILLEEGQKDS